MTLFQILLLKHHFWTNTFDFGLVILTVCFGSRFSHLVSCMINCVFRSLPFVFCAFCCWRIMSAPCAHHLLLSLCHLVHLSTPCAHHFDVKNDHVVLEDVLTFQSYLERLCAILDHAFHIWRHKTMSCVFSDDLFGLGQPGCRFMPSTPWLARLLLC